ncbi:MAG: peptide chain release factor 2 [Flavobacteriales bacterium]|nr:peptide chain release factor 2 [Flavobacteriales bacterium]
MINEENILDLKNRLNSLYNYLEISNKKGEIKLLEIDTQKDNFWDTPKSAEKKLKEINQIKIWTQLYEKNQRLIEDLTVMHEFYKQNECEELELNSIYEECLKSIEDFEFKNMLSAKEDNMSAILTINPGAGGTESQDWAEMIMRMYLMWGEKNKYKVKQIDLQKAEPAGIKSATLEFEGEFAYGNLKSENGVHRLVRISPFDSNAKRHTSFASVFVYPLADETINIVIDPSEISWDTFRSSGAGGQGVNKIESAVRLKHEPSGIIIENSETRSQLENKEKAMRLLKSQLYELELRKLQEEKNKIEGNKKKIEWGSQIRNYVLHPYKMVKDLRTNYESSNPESVLNGDINPFIREFLMQFGKNYQ